MGAANVVLHNRAGGAADNLKMTYAASNVPALGALNGKLPAGSWTLLVEDKARQDIGTLRGFSLEMQF
jgi:subtilisin-like proprotein convertase family protein